MIDIFITCTHGCQLRAVVGNGSSWRLHNTGMPWEWNGSPTHSKIAAAIFVLPILGSSNKAHGLVVGQVEAGGGGHSLSGRQIRRIRL